MFFVLVTEQETALYEAEGIATAETIKTLAWTTNQTLIDALVGRRNSLMASLEDQCLAPGGTDAGFLSAAKTALIRHERNVPLKVNGDVSFCVAHTIGPIVYHAEGFMSKNMDVTRAELTEIACASPNDVTRALFQQDVMAAELTASKGKLAKGRLIGSQFLNQLTRLMELINVSPRILL